MAQDKEFYIKIGGIKESIDNLTTLEEALSSIEKKVNTVNSNGGFTIVSKESIEAMDELGKLTQQLTQYEGEYQRAVETSKIALGDKNQEVKQAIELEKAEIAVQESALGNQNNSMNADSEGEYQRAVEASKIALSDKNQEVKQAIELEKANIAVQEGVKNIYYEKQQLLNALGNQIKSMNADTEEEKQKQQELISQYSSLIQELKDFDTALGNHQRNVGDYSGALNETTKEAKAMDELGKLTQKITQYDEEYQRAVEASKGVLKDKNQEVKQAIELEKAEIVVQEGAKSTYYEKQQLLSALGKQIKSMNTDTEEEKQKQQELISQYSSLNQELKDFDASLGNHQRNVGDYGQATKNLKQELKELQAEMATMLTDGVDKADPKFVELARKAGALKDAIGDAGEEINRFASDTKKLDDVINVAQSATAAFELYKGAMSAFGLETEGAEEAIQKLAGAMSIIQSLQTLQETLSQGSATAKLFNVALKATGVELVTTQLASIKATAAQEGLTVAQKAGTIATKTLSLAIKAIPLMLVIGLVTELILHWEDLVGWFNKTFPALNKLGGAMNALKAVFVGLGKAIINWVTNPLKTLANVISKIFQGDFEGALKAATDGIKNQFKGTVDAFNSGYKAQIEQGLDDIAKKAAAKQAEQTKYELEQLKARKGNQARYSKEGIALQKKEFAERKKAAKGNADELKKIALDEANFFRECEEQKAAAAKKGAAARVKANKAVSDAAKKAADEEAKRQKEALEFRVKADKKLYQSTAEYLLAQKNIEIENAEAQVDLYKNGPVEKYKEAVGKVNEKLKEYETLQRQANLYNFFDDYRSNIDASLDNLNKFMEAINNIVKKSQEYGKTVPTEMFAEFAKENEIFKNLTEDQYKYLYGIYIQYIKDGLKNKKQLEEETNKKIAGQTISINKNTIDEITANLRHLTSDKSPEGASVFSRIFNPKKAKEAYQNYKDYWKKVLDETNKYMPILETTWDAYLESVKTVYKEDSKEYIEALEKKKKALQEFYNLQSKATSASNGDVVEDNNKKRNKSPINPDEYTTNANGDTNWDALWDKSANLTDNLVNNFKLLDETVLGPAMDTFSMFMDFAIEETAQRLEQVQEMHDKALDKVNESADKIKELNEAIKDSGNDNMDATKQQLADEQLLYAQRLAEEKKLAEEERNLKNKQAQQEANARKMELRYQLVMGIANTAQGASKALAQWGWPLGAIFAGIMTALGLVQTALIAKQISQIKPVKYAEGGLLQGASHANGGIPVGNTGIEVEGGEMVVSKKNTVKYIDVLTKINRDDPSVRYLRGGNIQYADTRIRKFANGGQLNFKAADDNLRANSETNRLMGAINDIDMSPVVSVVDIWKAENRLTKVRGLAGRE